MGRLVSREYPDWYGLDDAAITALRKGQCSDAYFNHTAAVLEGLARDGYAHPNGGDLGVRGEGLPVGDLEVEMQFFTRRAPYAVVSGMGEALALLRECAGHYDELADLGFVRGFDSLEVEAVGDGFRAEYGGDPEAVLPVLRIRGPYRLFGRLETPLLGVLAHGSRIATNAHRVVSAAGGKRVLFFPARFDHWRMQAQQGYAWSVAVARWNADNPKRTIPLAVSTDAQASGWGGRGTGTTSHATIAAFLGDAGEVMLRFAEAMPADVPRVALVDFHNDCVADTERVVRALFARYRELVEAGDFRQAQRFQLDGVRPDTGGSMRDVSQDVGSGVTVGLVRAIRDRLDGLPGHLAAERDDAVTFALAKGFCDRVEITVTGGFGEDRIREFERLGAPVAAYGVGSSLLSNSSAEGTCTDFTADIVRVRLADGTWADLSKTGRRACGNPALERVV